MPIGLPEIVWSHLAPELILVGSAMVLLLAGTLS
jgi:hypothetical protein